MCTPWTFTAGRAWKRYFLGKDNGCNSTLDIWHELVIYDSPLATMMYFYHICIYSTVKCRAGNSLNLFLSKSLVFLRKNERIRDLLKKNEPFFHSLIFGERPEWFAHGCSFLGSNLNESLMVAHFWWATWAICSHHSFLVSDLSDSLTLLTKKEGMSDSLIF